jgi:protein-disulfide isomerase
VPAAKAAYCAGQQDPKKFWAMHDWLFANQAAWSEAQDAAAALKAQAVTLGVDAAKYDACVADAKTDAAIKADMADGTSRGVSGTPAFFLSKVDAQGKASDTKPIVGAVPLEQFAEAIKGLLGQ